MKDKATGLVTAFTLPKYSGVPQNVLVLSPGLTAFDNPKSVNEMCPVVGKRRSGKSREQSQR